MATTPTPNSETRTVPLKLDGKIIGTAWAEGGDFHCQVTDPDAAEMLRGAPIQVSIDLTRTEDTK